LHAGYVTIEYDTACRKFRQKVPNEKNLNIYLWACKDREIPLEVVYKWSLS